MSKKNDDIDYLDVTYAENDKPRTDFPFKLAKHIVNKLIICFFLNQWLNIVMRNKTQSMIITDSDLVDKKDLFIRDKKTTDINILLNRVKLDKKKDLKKRLFFFSLLLAVISLIGFFAII